LSIRDEFAATAQRDDHPLTDFRIGIGLATGPAVAGRIGTVDQVKVTVFGPVVNLAARLETMTKVLRAPVLIDEETARRVRASVSPDVARVRRVACVRPYGLASAVEVSELLPPESQFPQLTDEHIAAYETALDALRNRDWEAAFQWLHRVPAEDRVKDYLTVFIAQHNRMPPADWDGVIPIDTK
jgi:adenylate cyclase